MPNVEEKSTKKRKKMLLFRSILSYSLIQTLNTMSINIATEERVGTICDLLLNIAGKDNNCAFFRTFDDGDLSEVEKSPCDMSAYLGNMFDNSVDLYVSIHPYATGMDVVISTYERG